MYFVLLNCTIQPQLSWKKKQSGLKRFKFQRVLGEAMFNLTSVVNREREAQTSMGGLTAR